MKNPDLAKCQEYLADREGGRLGRSPLSMTKGKSWAHIDENPHMGARQNSDEKHVTECA